MGALEAVIAAGIARLRRTVDPTITNPTFTDAGGKDLVGISRDRTVTYWSDTASATAGQFYTSTDDGVTFSAGWMSSPYPAQITAIAETAMGELLIATYGNGSRGQVYRTTGWQTRTGPSNWGTSVISCSDFGNHLRPWNLNDQAIAGDVIFLVEYGKNAGTSTLQARAGWVSRDDGQTFVQVWDLFSPVAGVGGPGFDSAVTGYHNHCSIVDPWTGRIWITVGDSNDGIWYSDDAARIRVIADASTTSGSTTLTSNNTTRNTFSALDVGQSVYGAGIPAGATIASVTNKYTAVLSAAATATASTVKVAVGNSTWRRAHEGRGGLFQATGMVSLPEAVAFGSDGYPGGVQVSRKGRGQAIPILDNGARVNVGTSTSTVCNYAYRAKSHAAPALVALQVSSAGGAAEPGRLMASVDGERWFTIWADTAKPGPGSGFQIAVHTALGNVLGMVVSNRTASGKQVFRAKVPLFPNAEAWV